MAFPLSLSLFRQEHRRDGGVYTFTPSSRHAPHSSLFPTPLSCVSVSVSVFLFSPGWYVAKLEGEEEGERIEKEELQRDLKKERGNETRRDIESSIGRVPLFKFISLPELHNLRTFTALNDLYTLTLNPEMRRGGWLLPSGANE